MKTKTIKAVLAKKHQDFVKSIEDEEVRNLVDKNSIITGGSIVSMLLGEEVNDFDYYFTDKNTALKVAQYYCRKFMEKTGKSQIFAEEDENGRIKVFVKSRGIVSDDDLIEPSIDPTTEFDDEGVDELTLDEIKSKSSESDADKYRPIFLSTNAISLTGKVQLVVRFYGDPEEIHSNYDFVHCTSCWVSKDNKLVLPQAALEAILTKELVYTGSKYPLCSIMRTKKFIKRGWHINAGQYLKMTLQLNELNLLDVNVLEDQLTGVDSAYFLHAIDCIKKKQEQDENFKLDNSYLFEVINRIF